MIVYNIKDIIGLIILLIAGISISIIFLIDWIKRKRKK